MVTVLFIRTDRLSCINIRVIIIIIIIIINIRKVHVMSHELIFRAAMLEQSNNLEQCSNNIVTL